MESNTSGPNSPTKGLRILVVEDHPLLQDALKAILSGEFAVDLIERGDTAIAEARKIQPDVIVLDISLPGLSGMQVLSRLRRELPDTAVVMLTAYSDRVYQEEAFARGANAFVRKGSAATALLPAIHSAVAAISRTRARRA